MPKITSARMQDHFAELTDPRRRKVTYPLINIVVIAVCAVIWGADDFVAIARFGRTKRKWLARFLDLTNGILATLPVACLPVVPSADRWAVRDDDPGPARARFVGGERVAALNEQPLFLIHRA